MQMSFAFVKQITIAPSRKLIAFFQFFQGLRFH